jgi:hypothetical protein
MKVYYIKDRAKEREREKNEQNRKQRKQATKGMKGCHKRKKINGRKKET